MDEGSNRNRYYGSDEQRGLTRKAAHPFRCRLTESAAFTVTAPNALTAGGFASMGMGFFTLFRPTHLLLYLLATRLKGNERMWFIRKDLVVATIFSWDGVLLFVLVLMGFVLTFSVKIKKRGVLLLHPWGLMVLYLDVFVWLTLALYLHLGILSVGALHDDLFSQIKSPLTYFVFIYIDTIIFFVVYYIYATYFIAAELSVIEKCY